MARPIYPHELVDPDFQWLISTYRETHPHVVMVEASCLPVVMIFSPEGAMHSRLEGVSSVDPAAVLPGAGADELGDDLADEQDL